MFYIEDGAVYNVVFWWYTQTKESIKHIHYYLYSVSDWN